MKAPVIVYTLLFSLLTARSFAQPQDSLSSIVEAEVRSAEEDSLLVDRLIDKGYSYWSSNPQLVELFGKKALEIATRINYEMGVATAYYVIGISHWSRSNYDLALENYLMALEANDRINHLHGKASTLGAIGIIFTNMGNHRKAIECGLEAVEIYKQLNSPIDLGHSLTNVGYSYNMMDKPDSALYFHSEALAIYLQLNSRNDIARSMENIGACHEKKGEYQKALSYFYSALTINRNSGDLKLRSALYLYAGRSYLKLGQLRSAKIYLDSTIQVAKAIGSLDREMEAYQFLKEAELLEENYQAAYNHLLLEYELKRQITNADKTTRLQALQSRFNTSRNEKERTHALRLQAREQANRYIAIAGMISVTLLMGAIIGRQRLTIKKNKELFRSQEQLEHVALQNQKMKEKELETELAQKNKELTSFAINFIQKSSFLTELTQKISALSGEVDAGNAAQLQQFNQKISRLFNMEKDWADFDLLFEQTYSSFFTSLQARFPDLTANERKLCALTRLNLSAADMAGMLGISQESVRTAKYRLRKKLQLNENENFDSLMLTLNTANS